jgi:hypothetical protein
MIIMRSVKVDTSKKLAASGIVVLLVLMGIGVILWHYLQQQPEMTGQAAQKESPKAKLYDNSLSERKPVAVPDVQPSDALSKADLLEEENGAYDEDVDDLLVWLDDLEENLPMEAVEKEIDKAEDGTVGSNPTPQQQGRLEYAAYAATRLPVLVDEWKEIMSERGGLDSIYGESYSDAKAKEFNRLQEERKEIEHEFIKLAFSYHGAHPEEGAIFYPEGWIGQLGKQIGLVFGKRPD